MPKTYVCSFEVRGYEMDSFGHVNHAVYFNYLEHARWELLAQEGITVKTMAEMKRWPVIAQVEAKYLRPTFMGDALQIRSRVASRGGSHFLIEQEMYRGDECVFKASLKAVMVNEKGRPSDIPEHYGKLWKEE